jgi:hypothetical protein
VTGSGRCDGATGPGMATGSETMMGPPPSASRPKAGSWTSVVLQFSYYFYFPQHHRVNK